MFERRGCVHLSRSKHLYGPRVRMSPLECVCSAMYLPLARVKDACGVVQPVRCDEHTDYCHLSALLKWLHLEAEVSALQVCTGC